MALAGAQHHGFARKLGSVLHTGFKLAGAAKTVYDIGKMVAPVVTALL